jgi:hypothetical protein
VALKRLATETSYIQHVLEDTLEEASEFGVFCALQESITRSEERQQEKIKIRLKFVRWKGHKDCNIVLQRDGEVHPS